MQTVWTMSCEIKRRETLKENIEADALVIGAGMAGVLTADALKSRGLKVVILEAFRIGSGQTSGTTAKITSQHGMIYDKLLQSLGRKAAGQYAEAAQKAIAEYEKLASERNIDCDFEKKPSFLYGMDEKELKKEEGAALSLGLPASYTKDIPFPIECSGALRFENQAQFNPLKFLKIMSEGLEIYERSPVIKVEENTAFTKEGSVRAGHIVFACHYPFIDFPGMYFARMHRERSYFIAVKGTPDIKGMYIGADENSYSLRNYKDMLFFGGEKQRSGDKDTPGRYDRLLIKAQQLFPGCAKVACWSAQDCMTPDSVPYIGRYSADTPGWYIATGFGKWGMTGSMVSSMLLSDLICKKDNPWAEVFDPSRFKPSDIKEIAGQGGQAVKSLAKRFFDIPDERISDIPNGQGGIVEIDGEAVGIYKDEEGIAWQIDPRCPHVGCRLEWNGDDRCWDCPCHGSRFDRYGRLICSPAQRDVTVEAERL